MVQQKGRAVLRSQWMKSRKAMATAMCARQVGLAARDAVDEEPKGNGDADEFLRVRSVAVGTQWMKSRKAMATGCASHEGSAPTREWRSAPIRGEAMEPRESHPEPGWPPTNPVSQFGRPWV